MFHNSGTARALLQWNIHKVCKAGLDTTVDLGELRNGQLAAQPNWGLNLEIKY